MTIEQEIDRATWGHNARGDEVKHTPRMVLRRITRLMQAAIERDGDLKLHVDDVAEPDGAEWDGAKGAHIPLRLSTGECFEVIVKPAPAGLFEQWGDDERTVAEQCHDR